MRKHCGKMFRAKSACYAGISIVGINILIKKNDLVLVLRHDDINAEILVNNTIIRTFFFEEKGSYPTFFSNFEEVICEMG